MLCYVKTGYNPDAKWKISFPQQLLLPLIQYFNTILGHPGATRMFLKMQTRYYHPTLRKEIEDFACKTCQRMKQPGPGCGLLPEQYVGMVPWAKISVDIIGMWTVK